ncbi:MAG: hypothetical protein M3Y49_13860 [Actinomycetota bacterium]|nr:hypothetical protein [Actinomycetota bacterium]
MDDHRDQHMIAGYGAFPFVYSDALSKEQAGELGRMLEQSWREQFREERAIAGRPAGGVSAAALSGADRGDVLSLDLAGLEGESSSAGKDPGRNFKEHVYHVVVSLGPQEGQYTDDQWDQVACGVVQGMGFSTGPGDMNANAWVAVRHGLSAQGNDHIHIAVNLVRQDGVRTRLSNDKTLSQVVRRDLEQRLEFVSPLSELGHDRRPGEHRGLPAYTNKEAGEARARTAEGHPVVPDRVQLQRLVRAAAGASSTEAQFIQAVFDQGAGIEVARWAPGGHEMVTGYKVALDENARWFTASQLAPDLTLGALRKEWAPHETEQSLALALALWREETAPEESVEASSPAELDEHLAAAGDHLEQWAQQLREVDPNDTTRWAMETANAARVASALTPPLPLPVERDEERQPVPVPTGIVLGAGADALTRVSLNTRHEPAPTTQLPASTDRPPTTSTEANPFIEAVTPAKDYNPFIAAVTPTPAPQVLPVVPAGPSHAELAARHVMIAIRASGPDHYRGWLAVMQQFSRTVGAIHHAQQARGELALAQRVQTDTLGALTQVQDRLERMAKPAAPAPSGHHETPWEELSPAAQRVRASMLHGFPGNRLHLNPAPPGTSKTDLTRPRPGRSLPSDHGKGRRR